MDERHREGIAEPTTEAAPVETEPAPAETEPTEVPTEAAPISPVIE